MKEEPNKTLLKKYIESVKNLNEIIDNLRSAGINLDDKVIDAIYTPVHLAAKAVEELINQEGADWIEWFIWDNNFGESGFQAGCAENIRPIKSVDDLWDLMNE